MKPIRENLGLVADIFGIISFAGLSATGIVAWLQLQGDTSWLLIGVIFVIGFVIPISALLTIKKWGPDAISWLYSKSFPQVAPMKEFTLNAADLPRRLPSDQTIRKQFDRLLGHVHTWDPEASLTLVSLRFNIVRSGTITIFNMKAESSKKRRQLILTIVSDEDYEGKIQQGLAELRHPHRQSLPFDKLFYIASSDWRDQIMIAFTSASDQKVKSLHIDVTTTALQPEPNVKISNNV